MYLFIEQVTAKDMFVKCKQHQHKIVNRLGKKIATQITQSLITRDGRGSLFHDSYGNDTD